MKREGFYLSFSAAVCLVFLAAALHSFPSNRSADWDTVYKLQQSHDLLTVWMLTESSFSEKVSDLQALGGKWRLEEGGKSWGGSTGRNAVVVEGLEVEDRRLEKISLTRFEDD